MSLRGKWVDAACLIGQPLLLNVISLPVMAYIIRRLGPVGYGQWMVATSLVAFTSFAANLGLRTLFVRAIAQNPDGAEEALAEQLGLRLLLSLLAGGAALALCLGLGYSRIVCQCAGLTVIGFLFTVLASVLADALQGFQQFSLFAGVNLIAGLLLTAASVVAIRFDLGPVGLSASYLVGPIVSSLLFLRIVRRRLFRVRIRWNRKRYAALLRDTRMMGAQQFLSAVQERIEQLLIPKLLGIGVFGYFAAGSMPAGRLAVFPDGLATAYYPKIARSYQEDAQNTPSEVSRLLTYSLAVCLPLAVLITFLAEPISRILFPKSAGLCRSIIQITIWSLPLLGLSLPIAYALQAVGKHSETARANMWAILGSVILSLLLISRFGILGACWSGVVRPLVSLVCLLPRFVRVFPSVVERVPWARVLCCALLMAGILLTAAKNHLSTFIAVGIISIFALLLYCAGLVILRVVYVPGLRKRLA